MKKAIFFLSLIISHSLLFGSSLKVQQAFHGEVLLDNVLVFKKYYLLYNPSSSIYNYPKNYIYELPNNYNTKKTKALEDGSISLKIKHKSLQKMLLDTSN